MRRSIVWIPVLFVGSMVYWTLALGMGGLSLVSVTADSLPCDELNQSDGVEPATVESSVAGEGAPRGGAMDYQPITVNLADPFDVPGEAGGSVTVDLVSDHPGIQADQSGVSADEQESFDRRGSGRRSRSDRGPGETAF